MTFIIQPAEEGEKMKCPNCGTELISRLKEYKDFPSKIQWQDKDQTKAHFDKNGNCKGETPEQAENAASQTTPTESTTKQKAPTFSQETISMIEGEAMTLYMIRNVVNKFLKKFEDTPHGGMVGQFTELIFEKHFKPVFTKAGEIKNE